MVHPNSKKWNSGEYLEGQATLSGTHDSAIGTIRSHVEAADAQKRGHGPNQASRDWNKLGLVGTKATNMSNTNPESRVRRCGRCEEYAIGRLGAGLSVLEIPAHSEDEHLDYARSRTKLPKDRVWDTAREAFSDGRRTAKTPTLD
jgi:hypothetical protein